MFFRYSRVCKQTERINEPNLITPLGRSGSFLCWLIKTNAILSGSVPFLAYKKGTRCRVVPVPIRGIPSRWLHRAPPLLSLCLLPRHIPALLGSPTRLAFPSTPLPSNVSLPVPVESSTYLHAHILLHYSPSQLLNLVVRTAMALVPVLESLKVDGNNLAD